MACSKQDYDTSKDFQNWLKAHIAIMITRDGIKDISMKVIKTFQEDIIEEVCKEKDITREQMCTDCSTANIIKCGTKSFCKTAQDGKCIRHRGDDFQRRCPKNICELIMKRICDVHVGVPAWENTNAKLWCRNEFEVAKCFMPPGREKITTVEQADFFALIGVMRTMKRFRRHFKDDISKGKNILRKARDVARCIRHSPQYSMSQSELEECITVFKDLFSDGLFSKHCAKSHKKIERLKELEQTEDYSASIPTSYIRKALFVGTATIVPEYLEGERTVGDECETHLDHREKTENVQDIKIIEIQEIQTAFKRYLEKEYLDPSDIKQLEADAQKKKKSKNNHRATTCNDGNGEAREFYNCIICCNNNKAVVTMPCKHFVMCRECVTLLKSDEVGQKLCPLCRDGIQYAYAYPDEQELGDESTLNESSTDTSPCVDEPQLSDDKTFSESTTEANPNLDHTTEEQLGDSEPADSNKVDDLCIATLPGFIDLKEDWNVCLDAADEIQAKELITKKILPDKHQLNKACTLFGQTSDITKEICSSMEDEITSVSDDIIYTEACYRETDQNKIVFVIYTAGTIDDIDAVVEKYSVLVRCFHHFSQEVNDVARKEMQEGMQFSESEMEELETILKTESPKLMKDHKNLTLTTASNIKSLHYTNCLQDQLLIENVSIVFYVTTKGLIPVGEDVLPRKLGKFDTDVREGRFTFAVGGSPGVKHKHLKIGCQIGCKDGSGTIGGFLQHPEHDLCALTCAHVLLNKEEILSFKKKNPIYTSGKSCFQPYCKEKEENKCGTLVLAKLDEGDTQKPGVDAALVKIDKDRVPTKGDFPDLNHKDIEGHCLHCKDDLLKKKLDFKSGIVLDTDEIPCQDYVVKYGQETKLTIGRIKIKEGSARGDILLDQNKMKQTPKGKEQKRYTFTLHNLLQIHGIGSTFARHGDSGSLVFSQDQNNKLSAIGILEGGLPNANITVVQPICSVLEEIGLQKPFSMINFDPRDRRIDGLEKNIQKILDKLSIQ